MIIFYDENGEVKGTMEGPTKEVEAGFQIDNYNKMEAPDDIAKRLADPKDILTHEYMSVSGSSVDVLPDKAIEKAIELRAEQAESEAARVSQSTE